MKARGPIKGDTWIKTACQGPTSLLLPDIHPTACWSFEGSEAQLGVLLQKPAFIRNVSIGHLSRAAFNTAPRDLTVWGVVDGPENELRFARSSKIIKKLRAELDIKTEPPMFNSLLVPLASVHFDIRYGNLIQMFAVFSEIAEAGMDFGIVIFQVHSNYGSDHTELYHVGIYGDFIQL
ncbi:hypothetical protein K474DRAFT_1610304 [Panus rudis PR-1116 ss-1]|nr:hypothetical protein K474DRAFT_1610304 [Panus rudis PR-1116 ss-1]